jgi:hypothetical protein
MLHYASTLRTWRNERLNFLKSVSILSDQERCFVNQCIEQDLAHGEVNITVESILNEMDPTIRFFWEMERNITKQ